MKQLIYDMVRFHRAIGAPTECAVCIPSAERIQLRIDLIEEECVRELLPALRELKGYVSGQADQESLRPLLAHVAKELADVMTVTLGCALELGMTHVFEKVWRVVHESNMAKANGPVRADGKRLKPEGWKPPNVYRAVFGTDARFRSIGS